MLVTGLLSGRAAIEGSGAPAKRHIGQAPKTGMLAANKNPGFPIMRRLLTSLALLALAASAQAREINCNIESDYDFSLNERSVIFTRESGVPKWVVIRGDTLFVDDRWVALSAEDRRRVAGFDRGIRQAMPLARQIARDATDIAFTTLAEVAVGFSSDATKTRAKLEQARKQIDARLARSVTATQFNSSDLGDGIGEAIAEVMPTLIGDIVGGAVSAALSGDTSRLQGMENLDKQIEARVEPRAKALEQRADQLCSKLKELDGLDNALAYRLPGGGTLNLLEEKPDTNVDTGKQR